MNIFIRNTRYSASFDAKTAVVTLSKKNGEIIEIQMQKKAEEEIMLLREGEKPGVIYKLKNQIFYTELPEGIGRIGFEFYPKCGQGCWKISGEISETGGCSRVSDWPSSTSKNEHKLEGSRRLEKYKFITEGIETINIGWGSEIFQVIECTRYIKTPRRNKELS